MNFVKTKFAEMDEAEPPGCVHLNAGGTGNSYVGGGGAGRKSTWKRRQI